MIEVGSPSGTVWDANPADLTQCALEPIHIPGAIQPHGALLITTRDASRITHASANLRDFLDREARDVLGQPLASLIGGDACRELLGGDASPDLMQRTACCVVQHGGRSLFLRSFRSADHWCVDLEPADVDALHTPHFASARSVVNSFRDAHSVNELCDLAVDGLRALSGYDRVMAYRFGAEGHGEVIAEARDAALPPYRGQRYPASDIPEQARRLYLRQRVGVIVDASYQPVPLLVEPGHDHPPVDLTLSSLRSVSPIHREFMRNMKTAASMTIGLESPGPPERRQLWGMLVCHHRTPRAAGHELRATADLIGHVLSLLIGSQAAAQIQSEQMNRQSTLAHIIARLAQPDPITETLSGLTGDLLSLARASGVVVRLHGEQLCLGRTPGPAEIDALFDVLRTEAGGDSVAVDDLGARDTRFSGCAEFCSGALMLPILKNRDNALIWIRPERAQTVIWGGNPAKATSADAVTGRISPRASFAAWKEEVRGRSVPWSEADLALAVELRQGIESELARRTNRVLDLYGRIFDSSPVALMLIDASGHISMANGEAARIFGYAQEEFPGQQIERLMPGPFRAAHVALRQGYLRNPSLRKMGGADDLHGLRKDGSEFPLEIWLNPVAAREGLGDSLVQASLTDLTARRKNERAARALQDRLESITTHVPAMIGYWNRELRCEFANDAYRVWFGRTPECLMGKTMQELLGEELFRQNEPFVRGVLGGVAQRFDRVLQRPDGSVGYCDAQYLPDLDEHGTVCGFYVLVTDVTSLHDAQVAIEVTNAELANTNRELDEFVYTASHDLRSPLRAIGALATFVLEDDPTLQSESRDRIRMILSRSERMQRMLDQILEYAQAGATGGQGAALPVTRLIDDVVAVSAGPPAFTIVKDASLEAVQVQPVPLSQVLQNLIGNAIKHHDAAHGTVTVSAERVGSHWRFWVVDDGPGIPEEYRETVFDMFATLKRRDEVEASGMGLALVRKLVQRQGGSCGVAPAAVRGTRIWFDWPACEKQE